MSVYIIKKKNTFTHVIEPMFYTKIFDMGIPIE